MTTENFEDTDKRLKPAKNIRWINVKVCATCKHFRNTDGFGYCIRPDGPDFDIGDMKHWQTTCDLWADAVEAY